MIAVVLGVVWAVAEPVGGSPWAEVQRYLSKQYLYRGEAHGQIDAETRLAIRRYQILHGLPASGEIDSGTLRKMNLAPSPDLIEADRRFLRENYPHGSHAGNPGVQHQ